MLVAEGPTATRNVVAAPSFVLDLSWALHAAEKEYLREQHPVVGTLYDATPGLVDRVRTFWPDGSACFTELQTLGHLAGSLTELDPARALDAVAHAIERSPDHVALPSESAEDAVRFNERLTVLRDDAALRRRYLALLSHVTDTIGGPWCAQGLPAAQATAEILTTRLAQGARWIDLVPVQCDVFLARREDVLAEVDAGTPVLIAVCAFFGSALYLNFDGAVVVGAGVERDDLASRARTEDLARRLKVLADPTRLAIVDYVTGTPRTVGEITRTFHLAQPTVSNHVKTLRDAGLVVAERHRGRLVVAADRQAVADLVARLGALVT